MSDYVDDETHLDQRRFRLNLRKVEKNDIYWDSH